ncbi:hypothetical protein QTP88_016193 [Uroleucon formosanum]
MTLVATVTRSFPHYHLMARRTVERRERTDCTTTTTEYRTTESRAAAAAAAEEDRSLTSPPNIRYGRFRTRLSSYSALAADPRTIRIPIVLFFFLVVIDITVAFIVRTNMVLSLRIAHRRAACQYVNREDDSIPCPQHLC